MSHTTCHMPHATCHMLHARPAYCIQHRLAYCPQHMPASTCDCSTYLPPLFTRYSPTVPLRLQCSFDVYRWKFVQPELRKTNRIIVHYDLFWVTFIVVTAIMYIPYINVHVGNEDCHIGLGTCCMLVITFDVFLRIAAHWHFRVRRRNLEPVLSESNDNLAFKVICSIV